MAFKLTTVQLTKLPLEHKISKIEMVCFTKTGMREDLHLVLNEESSVTYICAILILDKGQVYS